MGSLVNGRLKGCDSQIHIWLEMQWACCVFVTLDIRLELASVIASAPHDGET